MKNSTTTRRRRSVRLRLRQYYARTANQSQNEIDARELQRSALVFSPHQDDETLGCGGTIIRKREVGADVTIVFMTDGRQSHSHIIPASELTSIRKREAVAAGNVLGVEEENVIFLNIEDRRLGDYHDVAVRMVEGLLAEYNPEEVYIPYSNDLTADHLATNRIVLAALKARNENILVFEYPVWFWYHWPWVRVRQNDRSATRSALKNTFISRMGLRLLRDFNHAVYVSDVLARKREALEQHESQMTQLVPDSRWLTLHDVSEGEFLACFFQDYEVFHHYHLDGAG